MSSSLSLWYRVNSVLYHVSDRARFARVKWLLERPGVCCFVPICLLVSPIFAGFLSVMLSVMLSAFSSWLLMCSLFGLQMASYKRKQDPNLRPLGYEPDELTTVLSCVMEFVLLRRIGSGGRIWTSESVFVSLLIGWFVGLLSGSFAVFAYVCLLVLMRVEGFCSLFCSHFIVELTL